jgi:hypothetical protein
MIKSGTKDFLMVFFDFSGYNELQEAMDDTLWLYKEYSNVKEIEAIIY